jgi:S-adenosylmethionine:tRNA ribosyltransferase-isomerase
MNATVTGPVREGARPSIGFTLPPHRLATTPPEERGIPRDGVRLLVAAPGQVRHLTFAALGTVLTPGDLVVVNTSATLPAALDATRSDRSPVVVHVAGRLADGRTRIELRRPDGRAPVLDGRVGEVLTLAHGTRVRLVSLADPPRRRLWVAAFSSDGPLEDELSAYGRPITYGYLDGTYPLSAYQPAVARHPGSAEMPSAARPLTPEVITDLVTRGIAVAPIVLHAGVSSLEADEPPQPEWFEVPEGTARLVNHTRRHGGRVVAIGTTVTRALESVASMGGSAGAEAGWTDLVLGPERPARTVDGLVTGWHEADASHLRLLEAVAGVELVRQAYDAALAGPYLWHEFGDSCLLLPDR